MSCSPNIQLHIEELVLEGIAPGDRHRVAQALQRELTRQLAQEGTGACPGIGGNIPTLHAGSVRFPARASPDATGVQLAQTILRSLQTIDSKPADPAANARS